MQISHSVPAKLQPPPRHAHSCASSRSGYSLVEIAIVLVLLGLLTSGIMTVGKGLTDAAKQRASNDTMDAIDRAIETYVKLNNRLPCPGDATLTEASANFGKEAQSPTQNLGDLCRNGSISSMYVGGETVAGSLPVAALGFPNSMARDPWDGLILYYVDRRMTAMDAFTTYNMADQIVGDISVGDLSGAARTTKAIYAVVSQGANTLGAFVKTGGQRGTSTDSLEQENYDFDGSSATAGDDRTLVVLSHFVIVPGC